MRKLFYLGFCLALVTGVGCALTDYEIITDNNQTSNGSTNGDGIINTNGKAHVRESSQIATIWPDGTDEIIWFVDQKANGDQTITNYNNFSTGAEPTFHDDLYCNPDWTGCSVLTADNPVVGDDPFDYNANPNCDGYRSLSILISSTRYYGECGRGKVSLADRISLLNMGRLGQQYGTEGLFFDFNRSNTSILLDNKAGFQTSLPMNGDVPAFLSMNGERRLALDMTNPLLGTVGRSYASFLGEHATGQTGVTVTYNGISASGNIAGNYGVSNPGRVNANVNKHY